ncbi:hypothetical protein GQ457_15G024160 [Hibiscus cannabinus]
MSVGLRAAEATPRVSFSHYLFSPIQHSYYCLPLRSTPPPLDSSTEFAFDVRVNNSDDQECCYSSADELFADGKILPLQIKKQTVLPSREPLSRLDGVDVGSKNQSRSWRGNKPRLCPPKVKPEGHRNRKGNHRQDRKSGFINPLLSVPLVDVFCLSSIFSSGSRKK